MRKLTVFVILAFASRVLAEEAPALAPGGRVRVSASSLSEPIRGTLASIDDERLAVQPPDGAAAIVIERSRITRIEISSGPRSRRHKAAIGAVAGVAAGLVLTAGLALGGDDSEDSAYGAAYGLILFTPMLTISGALVGLALPPGEQWKNVPTGGLRSTGSVPPLGLRLAVRF